MRAHTNYQKEVPAGSGNCTAGSAHTLIVPQVCNRIKAYSYLQAGIFGRRV